MRRNFLTAWRRIAALAMIGAFFVFPPPARAFIPNDPGFTEQWYLRAIGAPTAWNYTFGAPAVTVALLDTGVDLDHPELARSIWYNVREQLNGVDDDGNGFPDDVRGWNFVDDVGDPQPRFTSFVPAGVNHGTVIAGELVGRGGNGQGIAGLAWRIRLMPVRVLSSEGRGGEEQVVKGIDYAIRNGADIISMSFVTTPTQVLRDAIRRAHDAGVLVVAAAGLQLNNLDRPNVGPDLDQFPGDPVCADGPNGENWVIGVGSVDADDHLSRASGYGRCIDIVAPGEQIYSTQVVDPAHGFVSPYGGGWIGPSLATPLVAGAAALIKSAQPTLTVDALRDRLLNTAENIDAKNPLLAGKLGHGRLNLARVFETLGAPRLRPSEISVARGPGAPPEVRMLDAGGAVLRSFYAYDPSFRGGVQLAAGDVDGDGHDEIVTAAGPGGGPRVRVFDANGSLMKQFFASDQKDKRGFNVAVSDLDGDGRGEIVIAPMSGEPRVRIFESDGTQRTSFLAYEARFKGGIQLAAGDLDGDGRGEIVTAPARGGGPRVRIWNRLGLQRGEFMAGPPTFTKGVTIAIADRDADDHYSILVQRRGEKIFSDYDREGRLLGTFVAPASSAPLEFVAGDIDRDGADEIIIGGARSGALTAQNRGGDVFNMSPFGVGRASLRAAVVAFP